MDTCMHTCRRPYKIIHIHTHRYTYIHIRMRIHIRTHAHTHTYISYCCVAFRCNLFPSPVEEWVLVQQRCFSELRSGMGGKTGEQVTRPSDPRNEDAQLMDSETDFGFGFTMVTFVMWKLTKYLASSHLVPAVFLPTVVGRLKT